MIYYHVTMRHTEETFKALAHKQYDLFCKGNQVGRSLISIAALVAGIANFSKWWGCLLLAYGSFIASSKYASANRTAQKLVNGIKASGMEMPASRYLFRENSMEIITLPENTSLGDPLVYSEIHKLGEDGDYFYLFRDQYGGYMIPKAELGKNEDRFRDFIEERSGQVIEAQIAPVFKLLRRLSSRKNKSRHQ